MEIESAEQLLAIKKILIKEIIDNRDVAELIKIFGNYEEQLSSDEILKITVEIYGSVDVNQMYFSI